MRVMNGIISVGNRSSFYANKSIPTTPAKTPKPVVALTPLAAPVKGIAPVLPGGLTLPTALALPTTVPKVVAPTGLFAPGPAVGVAGTGTGEPAAKPTFGLEVSPGAEGAVVKPTCGTTTWVLRREEQEVGTWGWPSASWETGQA